MRLIDYLEQYAKAEPNRLFIKQQDGLSVSYSEFWHRVCLEAERLCVVHKPHTAWVFRTTQDIDHLVRYFACHRAEVVAVPVEHDLPVDALSHIEARVAGQLFPEEAADILFTTGTTGAPKGVVLSHKALMVDARNLMERLGIHHDLTFVITGPLNHFGCHSKVLPVVLTGGLLYLLQGMKSVDAFFGALNDTEGHIGTFLVPASIRMLLQFSADRLASFASRIELIETGAAPITQVDMQRLSELLPHSRLFNTYAGSEVGVVCSYNFNDGLSLPGCVGASFPYSRVEVRDEVVICSGEGLMMGYLGQPLVETQPEIETSDLGYLDAEGHLFLTGRQSDLINVGGLKVSPVEVEEAAMALLPGLRDCICIAHPHPVMGFVPKLLVLMDDTESFDKRAAARALRSRLESYKMPVDIQPVSHIERTYNGKLNRKYYRG